jgi:anti-sigma B factor antagonist
MTGVPPSLTITGTPTGVAIAGEIDGQSVPLVESALRGQTGQQVTVDLSGVDFVDSSGLRVLIEMHQRFEADGRRLTLQQISPVVSRLFDISGVTHYLHVTD